MYRYNIKPNTISRIFSTILSGALFLTYFTLIGYSQDESIVEATQAESQITIEHNLPDYVPLKVELFNLDSTDVLRDFQVKVTNISERPIYSIRFALKSVDVQVSGAPITSSFEYGRHALSGGANESEANKIKNTDKPINSGESVIFKLPKKAVDVRKKNIELGMYPKPKIYELVFIDLTYEDRTGFTKGGFFNSKKKL